HALAVDELGDARGHVDERVPVARARFEQKYAAAAVGTETVREHAAGGTGTDDHVVVGHGGNIVDQRARLRGFARADARLVEEFYRHADADRAEPPRDEVLPEGNAVGTAPIGRQRTQRFAGGVAFAAF